MPEPSFRHRLSVRWALPFMRAFVWLVLTLCGGVRVRGAYRVPRTGGVLILANHRSDLDPIAVQYACARPIHFMAKSELFDMRVIGPFIRWYGAFPVRRGAPDRTSLKRAVELLKAGEAVCVFPEGQLTQTGRLQPILPGAALIARLSGVPTITLGLIGTDRVLPYGKVIPRPAWPPTLLEWGDVRVFGKDSKDETVLGWIEAQLRELTDDQLPD